MRCQSYICAAVGAFVLCLGGSVAAQSQQQRCVDPAVAQLGNGFVSGMATVNGTSLYFVRRGSGPVVTLLHGFPQDWYEWRKTMPLLVKAFTVVAVDLRGVGKSSEAKDGYDAANLAEDIHHVAQQLKLEHAYVVGRRGRNGRVCAGPCSSGGHARCDDFGVPHSGDGAVGES